MRTTEDVCPEEGQGFRARQVAVSPAQLLSPGRADPSVGAQWLICEVVITTQALCGCKRG